MSARGLADCGLGGARGREVLGDPPLLMEQCYGQTFGETLFLNVGLNWKKKASSSITTYHCGFGLTLKRSRLCSPLNDKKAGFNRRIRPTFTLDVGLRNTTRPARLQDPLYTLGKTGLV